MMDCSEYMTIGPGVVVATIAIVVMLIVVSTFFGWDYLFWMLP